MWRLGYVFYIAEAVHTCFEWCVGMIGKEHSEADRTIHAWQSGCADPLHPPRRVGVPDANLLALAFQYPLYGFFSCRKRDDALGLVRSYRIFEVQTRSGPADTCIALLRVVETQATETSFRSCGSCQGECEIIIAYCQQKRTFR